MPFINVKANIPISDSAEQAMKRQLGDALTARVCDVIAGALGIAENRIYVKYAETPLWGWNGANF